MLHGVAGTCRKSLENNENKMQHAQHEMRPNFVSRFLFCCLRNSCLGVEATAGIEPACTDLQSAASPLRHVANREKGRQVPKPYIGPKARRQSQPEYLAFWPSLPQKEPPSAPLIEERNDRFCRRTPQYGGRSGAHC